MRILIIEDEHKIAQTLKQALERENYHVDISYDGDDGYSLAITKTYDLAIIDNVIPGNYNGVAIIKAMREAKIHTPVIILSDKNAPMGKAAEIDSGADDYLEKPFALQDLLTKMRELLRKPNETKETILTAGDLSLNTVTYEVRRADKLISLTGKEFALLEFLLRNQGRPVNKETIISHVWDYEADVLPNTVEVYMKYIRQKIDEPFEGTQLIQTARGFGYRIEA